MQPGLKFVRDICLFSALILPALPVSSAWSQAAAPAGGIADRLIGPDAAPDIDLAALRQQAADRIKARADQQPQKRPPIAPQLSKLPQVRFDVVFDPDTSIVRPASYPTIGSIADALYDPRLESERFLIVDHVESAGRRDHNLTLSQRRAEAIRDILVTTFKVSAKRLQALGLGEEQLQDVSRPGAPTNARAYIIAIGKLEVAEPAKPAAPAATAQKGAAAKKQKR